MSERKYKMVTAASLDYDGAQAGLKRRGQEAF
jgi:hypothetical protein